MQLVINLHIFIKQNVLTMEYKRESYPITRRFDKNISTRYMHINTEEKVNFYITCNKTGK